MSSLFRPSGPDPYSALARLLAKPQRYQRNLLRLSVWCEQGKCSPLRVFDLRDGLLVQCRSDADVSDMIGREGFAHAKPWSRRRAFYIEEWLTLGDPATRLQVVCECAQTKPLLVDVQKLFDVVPESGCAPRNVALVELCASDG